MDNRNSDNSIFLNGKAQIVEMLQFMPSQDRATLLKNLRVRNPQLAEELSEQCFTFSDINLFSDSELEIIFQYVKAPILGMALKNQDRTFQRRILSLAERSYAEEAFRVLKTPFETELRDSKRAQAKILEILSSLRKKNKFKI